MPDAPTEPEDAPAEAPRDPAVAGVTHAILAYLWWGAVTPTYFRMLDDAPPLELLAWRVLAGLPIVLPLVIWRGRLGELRAVFRSRRTMITLVAATMLISANWLVFILSVVWNRLSEASFGYYLNPLVSVLLGALLLGERLRPGQWTSIALATIGCVLLAVGLGGIPWISLVLAFSFGLYGLLRKQVRAEASTGLAVEMMLLLPAMTVLGGWLAMRPESVLQSGSPGKIGLLALGGLVTVVPLVLFASGARRLRLATVGMLQYIAPTMQLALAFFAFGEEIEPKRLIAFGFIWAAVLVYSFDAIRLRRRPRVRGEHAGGPVSSPTAVTPTAIDED